ncbi:MAG: site-2 protease family protein [Candidatus Aenigmarchaeota archaeon]|nr:site-2 protease family protein [Candidatus Aenigmarchaeota archaeon]
MRLHAEEIKDIAIAAASLVFIFSYPEFLSDASLLGVSAVAIASGFVLHELAHRFVANNFGAAARFRIWKEGLVMALVLAIATNGSFVFAAPGAVVISGLRFSLRGISSLGKREFGIISAAGPLTNIALAVFFSVLYNATFNTALLYAASINVSLALFNMIPIPPLDGSKVFAWSAKAWAAIIALIMALRLFAG